MQSKSRRIRSETYQIDPSSYYLDRRLRSSGRSDKMDGWMLYCEMYYTEQYMGLPPFGTWYVPPVRCDTWTWAPFDTCPPYGAIHGCGRYLPSLGVTPGLVQKLLVARTLSRFPALVLLATA